MSEEEAGGAPHQGDASEKQLNFVGLLREKIGISDEGLNELIREVCGKESLDELDRPDASQVIDELQIKAKEMGVDLDSQPKASEKQVNFIRSLKRRAHLTAAEFSALLKERAGVEQVEDVGRRDASVLIDELLSRADAAKSGGGGGGGGAQQSEPEPDDDVPF